MANYKQHTKRASNYPKRFSKYKAFKKAKKSPFSQKWAFLAIFGKLEENGNLSHHKH